MRHLIFFLIIAATFITCKPVHQEIYICPDYELNKADAISGDDYEIYNAILNSYYKDQLIHVIQKTIQGIQIKNDTFHTTDHGVVVVDYEIIADFNYNNLFSIMLGDHFSANVDRISRDEVNCFFSYGSEVSAPWNNYYDKYPDHIGYLNFSRIGYNNDRTMALVQYNRSCNNLCGEGGLLLMEKKSGNWIVKFELLNWVS